MIIEITSLIVLVIYVFVALSLKRELNIEDIIIVLVSIVSLLKCFSTLYIIIVEKENMEFLLYVIIGVVVIIWISYKKIYYILKKGIKS
ncbi:hypothetical protein [Halarcobacter sp.]|uniref:hypothetical protein n=1 Tax=Halarcobacter sp. TaxID=2321133 RepID=UPI002AAA7C25|nr:hypothetical protein [Halarcobacter sp.]